MHPNTDGAPGQTEFGKPSCSPPFQVMEILNAASLFQGPPPRQDHTLQGTWMQAFRLVFAVRAEKEALGRQKPSGVILAQDIPNDNPGSPDPVGLSFPQQSVRCGKVLPPCGHFV